MSLKNCVAKIPERVWDQISVVVVNVKVLKELSTVSLSCLSNSRNAPQPYRCRVSGATGANAYTPTPHGWNKH